MSWLTGLVSKRKKPEDSVESLIQKGNYLTAKDARMFTNFNSENEFIPLFEKISVDDLVKSILKEVHRFTVSSRKNPVKTASIIYTADILRSLGMEFRLGKRDNYDLDRIARHYADCRVVVICAIEALEGLGYKVRVLNVGQGAAQTPVLSIHW